MIEKIPTKVKSKTIIYAIQRNSDGLYSRGGTGPSWGKFPKTWGIGPFKNHVNMFSTNCYKFNLDRIKQAEDPSAPYYYRSYYANPEDYQQFKLLSKRFPYYDCEVLEIQADNLTVINRFSAPEWLWANVVHPYYKKEERYYPMIEEFCKEYGILL